MLNPKRVQALIAASRGNKQLRKFADGHGLYLGVRNGLGYWIVQWRDGQYSRSKNVGLAPEMSCAAARAAREELATKRRAGRIDRRGAAARNRHPDPILLPATSEETLENLLWRFLVDVAPTWKSGRAGLGDMHAQVIKEMQEREWGAADRIRGDIKQAILDGQGGHEAANYVTCFDRLPDFMSKPAASINVVEFRHAVEREWAAYLPTANRMMGRLEALLKFQKVGKNRRTEKKHHAALPHTEVAKLMSYLAEQDTVGARALRWTILTAARSGETREAVWREIQGDLWIVPAERMKPGRTHIVPLVPAMTACLGDREGDSEPLFRGVGGGFARQAFLRSALAGFDPDATPHGMRSTFRSWASEQPFYERDVAETALSHAVGDQTERAYDRSSRLEKRRVLMQRWADYCLGVAPLLQ